MKRNQSLSFLSRCRHDNAKKWDRDAVLDVLKRMYERAQEQDCFFKEQLLAEFSLYRELWYYWQQVFKNDETVFHTMKVIEQILNAKLIGKGLTYENHAKLVQFLLKIVGTPMFKLS